MVTDKLDVNIRDIQMEQLDMLLEFDKICKKNNIMYQLFAGTLLGAVRHNGFIPWDDDIDVCLLREDYIKFLNACKKDLDAKYFLQTYETDKNYIMQFAKIRENGTLFVEKGTSECKIHHGIYIDIFPLDNIQPTTFLGKMQRKILYIIGRINLCRVKMYCLNAKKPIEKYLSIIVHYFMKLIPKSWTDRLLTKITCIFANEESKYITHLTNGASKRNYYRYMMERSQFTNTINGKFEGYHFPIPENYDDVLTRLYGDYMKLPPIDKQQPHHGIIKIALNTQRRGNV